ncbi:MAG: hypothetical protein GY716_05410 [bacterium]|nr:hypothetical protein [bacterium]
MPGWHAETARLRDEGKLRMVGIVQEQHPDRARLFMQWKELDWPILVDSLNLLDVSLVPITLLIDEDGVIRRTTPPVAEARSAAQELVELPPASDSAAPVRPQKPSLKALRRAAEEGGAEDWRRYAEALILWGGPKRLDSAVEAFEQALRLDPADARAQFRLGVARRMRYDGAAGESDDFGAAVAAWSRALELDANNYIWRRRIQQFGPRLNKPYPFYDWVVRARAEIERRGGVPLALPVEPRGAEIAQPARVFAAADGAAVEPDPEGKIHRDPARYVRVTAAQVPGNVRPGTSTRVHLELRPNPEARAHWNNESGGVVLWIDPPQGWDADRRLIELENPPRAVSDEPRHAELELRSPRQGPAAAQLDVYALYYVCEGVKGACLYRRQDVSVPLSMEVR